MARRRRRPRRRRGRARGRRDRRVGAAGRRFGPRRAVRRELHRRRRRACSERDRACSGAHRRPRSCVPRGLPCCGLRARNRTTAWRLSTAAARRRATGMCSGVNELPQRRQVWWIELRRHATAEMNRVWDALSCTATGALRSHVHRQTGVRERPRHVHDEGLYRRMRNDGGPRRRQQLPNWACSARALRRVHDQVRLAAARAKRAPSWRAQSTARRP